MGRAVVDYHHLRCSTLRTASQKLPQCKALYCNKPVFVESDGRVHDYCSKTCARDDGALPKGQFSQPDEQIKKQGTDLAKMQDSEPDQVAAAIDTIVQAAKGKLGSMAKTFMNWFIIILAIASAVGIAMYLPGIRLATNQAMLGAYNVSAWTAGKTVNATIAAMCPSPMQVMPTDGITNRLGEIEEKLELLTDLIDINSQLRVSNEQRNADAIRMVHESIGGMRASIEQNKLTMQSLETKLMTDQMQELARLEKMIQQIEMMWHLVTPERVKHEIEAGGGTGELMVNPDRVKHEIKAGGGHRLAHGCIRPEGRFG